MEEEMKKEGVTFGEIVRIVCKKIWFILGASVLVTIATVLLAVFVINPKVGSYSLSFTINYPNRESMQYPDGTAFLYRNIISYDSLAEAKASDVMFKSIDIDKLYEENSISITAEKEEIRDILGDLTWKETGTYMVTAKKKCFPSREIASAFVQRLGAQVIDKINAMVVAIDNSVYLDTYENATSFSERIDALVSQREYLLGRYNSLIGVYDEGYSVTMQSKVRSLGSYRADVALIMSDRTRNMLRADLASNGYILSETTESIELSIKGLIAERAENNRIIDELKNAMSGISFTLTQADTFVSLLSSYAIRNAALETELIELCASWGRKYDPEIHSSMTYEQLKEKLDPLSKADGNEGAFITLLEKEYRDLVTATENYTAISIAMYKVESQIHFDTRSVVSEEEELSIVLVGAGSFILVFLIGAALQYFCYTHAEKVKKAAKGATAASEDEDQSQKETD